jgi:outer membrane biosynthesis protein TonB
VKNNLANHITLENYLLGKLTDAEMYQLERQAQDDPFLYEALEGFELSSNTAANLSMLQKQLQERIAQKEHTKKVFGLTWQRLSIAAAAAVTFITAGILFWMNTITPQAEEKLASQTGKEVHVTLPDTAEDTEAAAAMDSAAADAPVLASVPEKPVAVPAPNASARTTRKTNTENLVASNQATDIPAAAAKPGELSEVPVTAYGTQMKRDAAASVAKIEKQEMARQAQVSTALAGKVSGVTVTDKNAVIKGKVLGKDDNLPLPGVSVTIKGTNTGVMTDANGEFTIPAEDKNSLELRFLGYNTQTVDAKAGDDLTVKLEADARQLNEVVTVGYGSQRAVKDAEPPGGYEEYTDYLKSSVKKPASAPLVKGNVRVSFTVGTDGSLSNFRIVRGLTDACNAEAIRVIKEGPAWTPSSNGKAQQRIVDVPFK